MADHIDSIVDVIDPNFIAGLNQPIKLLNDVFSLTARCRFPPNQYFGAAGVDLDIQCFGKPLQVSIMFSEQSPGVFIVREFDC